MDLISVLVVFLCTLAAIFSMLYAYGMSNIQDIRDNWVQYRCNPIYMPMAGMVGSDISSNFLNCTLQSVNTYAGYVMDPIYQNFSILTSIFQYLLKTMNDMRAAVTGASSGFMGIIQSTFGKIQNTIQTTVQLFGRVRTIMNRMMAVFAVMMNIVSTGVQTGVSVKNGPVGQAAEFFCFHPSTLVFTDDGLIPMSAVRPGMRLADGQLIKSTLEFDSQGTKMYTIGSIWVSGNHKIRFGDQWIRVENHPIALEAPSCERVICLNTENHTIPICGFHFKDYEETSNPTILSEFFRRVERHYGRFHSPEKIKNPTKYRYTGIQSTSQVILANDQQVPASEVRIGDILKHGGEVDGIVHHRVEGKSTYNGVPVAPGTWVLNKDGVLPITDLQSGGTHEYIQFITRRCQYAVASTVGEFIILDDHEVADEDIHTWRDNEIQKEL
jgi:hypothetical protein